MKKTKFDSRIQEIAMTLNDLMLREKESLKLLEIQARKL